MARNRLASIFSKKGPSTQTPVHQGGGSSVNEGNNGDVHYSSHGIDRTIIQSIFTRISVDTASYKIRHVTLDSFGDIYEIQKSNINQLISRRANLDQTGRMFLQDIALTLVTKGVAVLVPVKYNADINVITKPMAHKITDVRVGTVTEWFPQEIKVSVYNDDTGRREELIVSKKLVVILTNPFYNTMNRSNSTVKRLVHKMSILDVIDKQSGSGRLDIIIQLPYTIKTTAKQKQADERKEAIEAQMANSKYGVAYVDSSEKITQLNRPAENNLMKQIEYLTRMLYSQLGIDETILDGTADEDRQLGYFNTILEPMLSAIADGITANWLSDEEDEDGGSEAMAVLKDPFRFVTATGLGSMLDALGRNELLSANESRGLLGRLPDKAKRSDVLLNKQIADNASVDRAPGTSSGDETLKNEVVNEEKEETHG